MRLNKYHVNWKNNKDLQLLNSILENGIKFRVVKE